LYNTTLTTKGENKMAKVGDAVSLTINGTKFAIPKDTEPNVIEGGDTITETQQFGDGTADAYVSRNIARITGLRIKVSDALDETFKSVRSMTDIPIVLQCVSKSYELTGCMVGEVEVSATRRITNEFEVHCTDGSGIRKS